MSQASRSARTGLNSIRREIRANRTRKNAKKNGRFTSFNRVDKDSENFHALIAFPFGPLYDSGRVERTNVPIWASPCPTEAGRRRRPHHAQVHLFDGLDRYARADSHRGERCVGSAPHLLLSETVLPAMLRRRPVLSRYGRGNGSPHYRHAGGSGPHQIVRHAEGPDAHHDVHVGAGLF